MEINLRDYQLEARDVFFQRLPEVQRQLMNLPTGSGKTVVASAIAKEFHTNINSKQPILFLVHRDELIKQTLEKMGLVWQGARIGVVKGALNEQDADVIVASIQTLVLGREIPRPGLVIYDEAHHSRAKGAMKLLERIGVLGRSASVPILGITATPMRSDRFGLGDVFQEITYEKTILDLILAGYLSDVRAKRIEVEGLNLDNIKSQRGDFNQTELGRAMSQDAVIETVVEAIKEHAHDRKTIVFAVNVEQTYKMASRLTESGIPALGIDGQLSADERSKRLEAFHKGDVQVMVNCMILTEGFDEPGVDCVVIARPTRSYGLFVQMVGRGTRKHPNKHDLLVLDVMGVTQHKNLVTTSQLFQTETSTESMADQESILEYLERVHEEEEQDKSPIQHRFINVDLLQLESQRLLWSALDGGWYGIDCGRINNANIRMFLIPCEGNPEFYWPIISVGNEVYRVFDLPISLEYAQGIIEDHIKALQIPETFVEKGARWRTRPMSGKQTSHAQKIGVAYEPWWTKGMLSDAINKHYLSQAKSGLQKNYHWYTELSVASGE